jgi:hypothetical protein
MFGLSFGKFLLLVFLGVVMWSILRFRSRVRVVRETFAEMQRQAERAARGNAPVSAPVSLNRCPVCEAYVATDAPACSRGNCPQGRRG